MNDYEIGQLLSVSDTSCISIIVPTHRHASGEHEDKYFLAKAIDQAKELLNEQVYLEKDELINQMYRLCSSIDFANNKDGIGLFISPVTSQIVDFPFAVKAKVSMSDHFEIRELLYYKSISDYWVLFLDRGAVLLFHGKGEELHEITDGNFPFFYENNYTYECCSAKTSSIRSFGRNVPVIHGHSCSFRTIDRAVEKYMSQGIPLVLFGEPHELAMYLKSTRYTHLIIGKVPVNNTVFQQKHARMIWSIVRDYLRLQNNVLVRKLPELVDRDMLVWGIDNIAKALEDGNGLVLLVEKNLELVQFGDTSRVNEIAREFMLKKGKVIFMDDAMLRDFGGMALILRYHFTRKNSE